MATLQATEMSWESMLGVADLAVGSAFVHRQASDTPHYGLAEWQEQTWMAATLQATATSWGSSLALLTSPLVRNPLQALSRVLLSLKLAPAYRTWDQLSETGWC